MNIRICLSACLGFEWGRVRTTEIDMAREADEKISCPLGELPLAILETVMAQTTPLDVARLAPVNRSFAEAAKSDLVWRNFLPADVDEIVKNSLGGPLAYTSAKGLYDRLTDHVLLGDGNQGYWIDRKTGRVHRSYSSRTLRIVWGETERYWQWIHHERSRFREVAFLQDVCWLDLSGEINTRLPPGTYSLSWILKFKRQASGWDSGPVTLSLTDGVQHHQTQVWWNFRHDAEQHEDWFRWSEYGMGQFTVERGDDPTSLGEVHLRFSMQEISRLHWKSGMYVDGVVIRPSP